MTTTPAVPDNAVPLEDGRWCVVRRVNVGDIRFAKVSAHERGFQDPDLDAIDLLTRVIVETSEGTVTQEFVDTISEDDYGKVWMKAKGVEVPNALAPSSTGTPAKAKTGAKRRTNG